MKKPRLLICARCASSDSDSGVQLIARVKKLRKALGARTLFKLSFARCLDLCDAPCAIQLEGKHRSTIARTGLVVDDAERLVAAAQGYAGLARGEELDERVLPGDHAD